EHLLEGRTAALEPILEFGTGSTCGSSLLQRRRALFVGQLGKGHGFLRLSPIGPSGSILFWLVVESASDDDRTHAVRRMRTPPPGEQPQNPRSEERRVGKER